MVLTKWAEFFTKLVDLPVRGVRTLASSLAKRCVGDPMVETMGLRGVPSLCILGVPYICGGLE